MQITEEIKKLIKQALVSLGLEVGSISLEHPGDLAHGDYSTNVAMVLAKKTGKNPREFAEQIRAHIPTHKYIKKVEVAGAGFINIFLSSDFFIDSLQSILSAGESWGRVSVFERQSVLIEHSSPNLFKPFHIGHLVNNTYGEALVRIYKNAGADVTTLSFPSDVSPGIAKAVWGLLDAGIENDFVIEQLGEAYANGVEAYEEDPNAKQVIDEININIYKQEVDTAEWEVYERGRDMSLEYFKNITQRLGSKFDDLIFESQAERVGKEVVSSNTPKVFEESEGAVVFLGSKYGLFDNVFINSAGFGTYLAKDTGLLKIKFDKFDFDKSIVITDTEQKQHFELVKKASELINPEWAEKSLNLHHGRLSLTTGRISSRDGAVPLAVDIIESVKEEASKRMQENNRTADTETAEALAIGAVKYAIARVGMGKNIVFDIKNSLSFEGDTGPYLQYTHARCISILNKVKLKSTKHLKFEDTKEFSGLDNLLYRFEEVTARSAIEQEPHYIANYLSELASAFNSWYGREQILDGGAEQDYKLAIVVAVARTLKHGLLLLGIDAPDKM